jgi:hypothetical protein
MTREEMAERLREIESDPWVPLRDLCMMLRASIKPARICVASGRGRVLEFAPRQAVPLPCVEVAKPEPTAARVSWGSAVADALAFCFVYFREAKTSVSLRKRPPVYLYTSRPKSGRW